MRNRPYSLDDNNGVSLLNLENMYLEHPNFVGGPHMHSCLEISCVKSGTSTYEFDSSEKKYDMQPLDVFVINNNESHFINISPGEKLVNMVIHFEPEFIWNNLKGLDYNFLKIFFERNQNFSHRLDRKNPATKRIFNLMLEIEQEFINRQPAYDLMVKIKLQSILVETIRSYDYIIITDEHNTMTKDKHAMLEVMKYINYNLTKDIKLETIASIALMSPSYFSTVFKKYNGITPFEYISFRRVQRSIELIKSTDKNLTEIATMSGFNNSTNFIKCFKKVTGETPSKYRKGNII